MKRYSVILLLSLLAVLPAHSQSTISIDYALQSIKLFEIRPDTKQRKPVHDLGAYMYDIGPAPVFQFDVHIEQLSNPAPQAKHTEIIVEQFMLLKSRQSHSYHKLNNSYSDLMATDPTWVYQYPVQLSFTCIQKEDVVCTSSPISPSFMSPDNPLTYAAPHAFQILGYAFRFTLVPSDTRIKDTNLSNNAYQVTFMKR